MSAAPPQPGTKITGVGFSCLSSSKKRSISSTLPPRTILTLVDSRSKYSATV